MVAEKKTATYFYVIIIKYVANTMRIFKKKYAWEILSITIYEKKWKVQDTIGDGDSTAD